MNSKVVKTIEKYNMPVNGARVIVALSGGSDSMTLLNVLYSLKDKMGFTLEAAHVNHCLRGESADRDERFAVSACEKLGIKCHVLRADVASLAREKGLSVEEAGRQVRYGFFASLGDDAVIATAHNLNDRVETMIFNLARGASLKGLCSIPPVRGNVIRPLIDCSKDEILEYCRENGIDYVTDETNSDVKYARNRVRHNVITELEEINSAFITAAGRCIDSINEDEALLYSMAENAVGKSRAQGGYGIASLCESPLPVLRRAVNIILKTELENAPDFAAIEEVTAALTEYSEMGRGKTVQLGGGRFLRTRAGIAEFPSHAGEKPQSVPLESGENRFGSFTVSITPGAAYDNSQKINGNECVYFIDSDKINGKFFVRAREEGDRISPAGRGVSKPLRKLQNENGIPPETRETAPVICDESGIAAAYGCGVDERVKADKTTVNVLEIKISFGG